MYIRRKVFSLLQDENGEERYFSTTDYTLENEEQREFGAKSKILGFVAPGSYQAKEAAKYGYDEDEYKSVRGKYALKGLFTPATATYIKKKAEQMEKEGKSKAEIRKYLENKQEGKKRNARLAAGVTEALLLPAMTAGGIAATGVGLYDKIAGNRAKDHKKKKK